MIQRDYDMHEKALHYRQSTLQNKSKRKTEMRLAARTKVRKSKVLHQVPLFSSMSESDITQVLAATKFETFSGGTLICSQGDFALKFYIVVSGSCKVLVKQSPPKPAKAASNQGSGINDKTKALPPPPHSDFTNESGLALVVPDREMEGTSGAMVEVATLNTLNFFGEGCLEQVSKDRRRMASVKASEEGATLLSLHRDDLDKLIEQEVIRCNVISTMRKTSRQRSLANVQSLQGTRGGTESRD